MIAAALSGLFGAGVGILGGLLGIFIGSAVMGISLFAVAIIPQPFFDGLRQLLRSPHRIQHFLLILRRLQKDECLEAYDMECAGFRQGPGGRVCRSGWGNYTALPF